MCFLYRSLTLFLTAWPSHLSQVSRWGRISKERQFGTALTAAWPLTSHNSLKLLTEQAAHYSWLTGVKKSMLKHSQTHTHTYTHSTLGTPSPADLLQKKGLSQAVLWMLESCVDLARKLHCASNTPIMTNNIFCCYIKFDLRWSSFFIK